MSLAIVKVRNEKVMDQHKIKTFKLFEALDENGNQSQRELAKRLEISLGLVNSLLKGIVKGGFFKIVSADKSRLKYVLTTKGISEKLSLTCGYLLHSIGYYRDIRLKVDQLVKHMEDNEVKDIVIVGANDFAEIVYIILLEKRLNFVGIVDNEKAGQKFLGLDISDFELLIKAKFDALIVTQPNTDSQTLKEIRDLGIETKQIFAIPPLVEF